MTFPGNDIAYVIAQLRNRMYRYVLARLADEGITGLTLSHGVIFITLYYDSPQSMRAISEKINRNKSTVTILVRKLESLGYIKREQDMTDKRSSIIHLTEKGFRFRAIFEQISSELIARIWGDKSPRERRKLEEELKSMLERL